MTTIATVKYKGEIAMASDSLITSGSISIVANDEPKFMRLSGVNKDIVVGISGSVHFSQLIHRALENTKVPISKTSMNDLNVKITKLLKAVRKILLEGEDKTDFEMVLASPKRILEVYTDGGIVNSTFTSLGSGALPAQGAYECMMLLEKEGYSFTAKDIVEKCVSSAINVNIESGGKIHSLLLK